MESEVTEFESVCHPHPSFPAFPAGNSFGGVVFGMVAMVLSPRIFLSDFVLRLMQSNQVLGVVVKNRKDKGNIMDDKITLIAIHDEGVGSKKTSVVYDLRGFSIIIVADPAESIMASHRSRFNATK